MTDPELLRRHLALQSLADAYDYVEDQNWKPAGYAIRAAIDHFHHITNQTNEDRQVLAKCYHLQARTLCKGSQTLPHQFYSRDTAETIMGQFQSSQQSLKKAITILQILEPRLEQDNRLLIISIAEYLSSGPAFLTLKGSDNYFVTPMGGPNSSIGLNEQQEYCNLAVTTLKKLEAITDDERHLLIQFLVLQTSFFIVTEPQKTRILLEEVIQNLQSLPEKHDKDYRDIAGYSKKVAKLYSDASEVGQSAKCQQAIYDALNAITIQSLEDKRALLAALFHLDEYYQSQRNKPELKNIWMKIIALLDSLANEDKRSHDIYTVIKYHVYLGLWFDDNKEAESQTLHETTATTLIDAINTDDADDKWSVAELLNQLGSFCGAQGQWLKQQQFCERALELLIAMNDDAWQVTQFSAEVANNLGIAYGNQGNWQKQQEFCEKAVQLLSEINYLSNEAQQAKALYLSNIGVACGQQGNLQKQLDYCEEAYQLSDKAHQYLERSTEDSDLSKRRHAHCAYTLGLVLGKQEDFQRQQQFYEEALVLAQSLTGKEDEDNSNFTLYAESYHAVLTPADVWAKELNYQPTSPMKTTVSTQTKVEEILKRPLFSNVNSQRTDEGKRTHAKRLHNRVYYLLHANINSQRYAHIVVRIITSLSFIHKKSDNDHRNLALYQSYLAILFEKSGALKEQQAYLLHAIQSLKAIQILNEVDKKNLAHYLGVLANLLEAQSKESVDPKQERINATIYYKEAVALLTECSDLNESEKWKLATHYNALRSFCAKTDIEAQQEYCELAINILHRLEGSNDVARRALVEGYRALSDLFKQKKDKRQHGECIQSIILYSNHIKANTDDDRRGYAEAVNLSIHSHKDKIGRDFPVAFVHQALKGLFEIQNRNDKDKRLIAKLIFALGQSLKENETEENDGSGYVRFSWQSSTDSLRSLQSQSHQYFEQQVLGFTFDDRHPSSRMQEYYRRAVEALTTVETKRDNDRRTIARYLGYVGALYNSHERYEEEDACNLKATRVLNELEKPRKRDQRAVFKILTVAIARIIKFRESTGNRLSGLPIPDRAFRSLALYYFELSAFYRNRGNIKEFRENIILSIETALEIKDKSDDDHRLIAQHANELDISYQHELSVAIQQKYGVIAIEQMRAVRNLSRADTYNLSQYYCNLGITYGFEAEWSNEQKFYQLAIDVFHSLPTKDNDMLLSFAQYHDSLGVAFGRENNWVKQKEKCLVAIEIYTTAEVPNVYSLAMSYYNLGIACGKLGETEDQEQYLFQATTLLEGQKESTDQIKCGLYQCYYGLSVAYRNQDKQDLAIKYGLLAYQTYNASERKTQIDFLLLAELAAYISKVYKTQDDLFLQEDYLLRAISVYSKIQDKNAARYRAGLAQCYYKLGFIAGNRKDWKQQQEFSEKAINLLIAKSGQVQISPLTLASCYNAAGIAYGEQGNWQLQVDYCQRAISLLPADLLRDDDDRRNLATYNHNLGVALGYLGNHQQRLDPLQRCINFCKSIISKSDRDKRSLANYYFELSNAFEQLTQGTSQINYYKNGLDTLAEMASTDEDYREIAHHTYHLSVLHKNYFEYELEIPRLTAAIQALLKISDKTRTDYHDLAHYHYSLGLPTSRQKPLRLQSINTAIGILTEHLDDNDTDKRALAEYLRQSYRVCDNIHLKQRYCEQSIDYLSQVQDKTDPDQENLINDLIEHLSLLIHQSIEHSTADKQRKCINRIIEIFNGLKDPSTDISRKAADAFYKLGNLEKELGNADEAIAAYRKAYFTLVKMPQKEPADAQILMRVCSSLRSFSLHNLIDYSLYSLAVSIFSEGVAADFDLMGEILKLERCFKTQFTPHSIIQDFRLLLTLLSKDYQFMPNNTVVETCALPNTQQALQAILGRTSNLMTLFTTIQNSPTFSLGVASQLLVVQSQLEELKQRFDTLAASQLQPSQNQQHPTSPLLLDGGSLSAKTPQTDDDRLLFDAELPFSFHQRLE